ncbi:CRISPR-associated protein Cse4 [Clostridium algidicarnis]|uniref:CRISPR-associated protein Cse4 n=1 Tax=Clostridium algidicarnis TaxID=37659 RepID=UPI001C0C183F|nr:CRISPR-associated protein Cse4 [Clostridium algidicarnis]MBU3207669.1 CRISPR-associated protein Cse4 [Clostridium algidicarnis]
MLRDSVEIFKKQYEDKGESYIIDSYIMANGTYILVDKSGTIKHIYEMDKSKLDKTDTFYYYFAKRDYLSKLISINKPIDNKKVIHSNNYLSFFIKKENINRSKLTQEILDNYYRILLNPLIKYTEKENKRMYEKAELKFGKANKDSIAQCKLWIEDNIFDLMDNNDIKKDKNYLKIFFEEDLSEYEKESEKYVIPNVYNNTQYNVEILNKTYGLPNDNMGLNAKKPFLELKTRKNPIPYFINEDEVILQKKFFDFLMNMASDGKNNIYLSYDNGIEAKPNNENIGKDFTGYFLKIKKGKEVEIHDFDTITGMKFNIKGLNIKQVIPINYGKFPAMLPTGNIENLTKLEQAINQVLFYKFLSTNYFTEPSDLKINNSELRRVILKYRTGFFDWFYKGNSNVIKGSFAKLSMTLIKNSICNESFIRSKEQFNLRCGVLNYLEGGEDMGDKLAELSSSLKVKINSDTTTNIDNDEEYFFAYGQLLSYFISLNKSGKKMHSLINPMLNAKSDEKLKLEMRKMFKKYSYAIEKRSKRFNNLYSMVCGYTPEGKVDEDILIAGYLYSSLIYEKKEDN